MPSRFGLYVLPGVRDTAWHEYAGTRSAGTEVIPNFEAVLRAQDVHHLIAVVMEVERRFGAGRGYLLERHDALPGLLVLQLQRGRSAGFNGPYWLLTR